LFGIIGAPNNPILHHKNSQGKKWSVNNNNNNNNNMREGPNKKKTTQVLKMAKVNQWP
jgi:hypothetical protein